MATLTSARQTYKATGQTTDCWCLRIEMEDGTRISITDAAEDLTVTERVKSDGTTESVTSHTYFSVANKLSAANKSQGMEPGTMDLEMLLGGTTTVESFTSEVSYLGEAQSVSTDVSDKTNLDNVIDGNLGTDWDGAAGGIVTNSDPNYLLLSFPAPVKFDTVILHSGTSGSATYMGKIDISDDGYRFTEIRPLIRKSYDNTNTFSLPLPVRSKYVKLSFGSPGGFFGSVEEVELKLTKSTTNRGYLTRNDILSGRMKNAKVYVFMTDYTDPKEDDEKVFSGFVGDIEMRDGRATALMNSLLDTLDHRSTRTYSASCDAQLGELRCGVRLDVPEWSSDMYAVTNLERDASTGTIIKPTTENGRYFKCVFRGTTGATEPTWDTTVGNNTNDGSAVWRAILAWTYTRAVGNVTSSTRLEISGITDFGSDWWANGYVEFLDGDLAGTKHKIQSSDTTGIDLQQGLEVTPSVGDSIKLVVGCDKRYTVCSDKFDNLDNFQGFRDLPGQRIIGKFGGQ